MESNLQSLPTFLGIYPTANKPDDDNHFGFDSTGLWFTGNSGDGDEGFPIRTNFSFGQSDIVEVVFTFIYNESCTDHGICFFLESQDPEWLWEPGANCLSFKLNCGIMQLDGLNSSVGGEESEQPVLPQDEGTYTCKVKYDPVQGLVTASLYYGVSTSGTLFSTLSLQEKLPAGKFRIGLDADQDNLSYKSYFTFLRITNLSNLKTCSAQPCPQPAFKCYVGQTASCTCATWKYFYPSCTRVQQQLGICNGSAGAYVPAIVVCNQKLF